MKINKKKINFYREIVQLVRIEVFLAILPDFLVNFSRTGIGVAYIEYPAIFTNSNAPAIIAVVDDLKIVSASGIFKSMSQFLSWTEVARKYRRSKWNFETYYCISNSPPRNPLCTYIPFHSIHRFYWGIRHLHDIPHRCCMERVQLQQKSENPKPSHWEI